MRDLRAFQGSALGQQKRALESGEWFDTDRMTVGGQGPSAMRLMDDEFIPIMGGPFHKQLYLHDYLLMHAREPRAAPWGQGSTSRRTRTPARSA
jgi:hypothetical protein